jgi:preprotein translocase subunit SecD
VNLRFVRHFLVLLVIVVTANIQGCDWLDGSSPSLRFFEVTSQGIGRKMAIVMDGKVLAAPVIREAISAGEAMVNLPFSGSEIKELTIVLNSGPYPADVRILEAAPIPASK